jgi:hypothetical protein
MDEASFFSREIEAHLDLQRQNSRLERRMPLERYRKEFTDDAPEDEPLAAEREEAEAPEPEPEAEHGFPAEDPDSWWDGRNDPETAEFGWR